MVVQVDPQPLLGIHVPALVPPQKEPETPRHVEAVGLLASLALSVVLTLLVMAAASTCRAEGVSRGHVMRAAQQVRPGDPPARGPGARRARGRADLHPRRHGHRRAPRPLAARRARDRGGRTLDALRDLQLPPVRNDGAGRSRLRRRRGAGGEAARRSGPLALPRGGHRADRAARRVRARGRGADGRLRCDGRLRGHLSADRLARAAVRVHRDRLAGVPARRRRPAHAAAHPDRGQRRECDPRGALRLRLRLGHRGLRLGNRDRPGGDGRGVRGRARPLGARQTCTRACG